MVKEKPGYGQFCPVSRTAEILAERWTPLVVRELLCGSTRFNDLQRGVPRMSPALLSKRLKELEHVGIVERHQAEKGRVTEYHLTESGKQLWPVIDSMGAWAQRWHQADLTEDKNLDPNLLMWDVHRRINVDELPLAKRYTILFQLSDMPANRRRYWIVITDGDVDLCIKDPGHEVDLYVSAALRVLTRIWIGHEGIAQARREGTLTLDGDADDLRAFPSWFSLSLTARHVAATP